MIGLFIKTPPIHVFSLQKLPCTISMEVCRRHTSAMTYIWVQHFCVKTKVVCILILQWMDIISLIMSLQMIMKIVKVTVCQVIFIIFLKMFKILSINGRKMHNMQSWRLCHMASQVKFLSLCPFVIYKIHSDFQ